MTQFQVGKTYWTRSPCDHNCIISAEIVARTAKTVTVAKAAPNERQTFRVAVWEGVETFKPWGSYSMAPMISADRIAA